MEKKEHKKPSRFEIIKNLKDEAKGAVKRLPENRLYPYQCNNPFSKDKEKQFKKIQKEVQVIVEDKLKGDQVYDPNTTDKRPIDLKGEKPKKVDVGLDNKRYF